MAVSNPGLPDQNSSFGKAFFILNIAFIRENGDTERLGAKKDHKLMVKSFLGEGMGFSLQNKKPKFRRDVTLPRWDHTKGSTGQLSPAEECCLKCHIQSLDYSKSQCFLLVASSHGKQIDGDPAVELSDGNFLKLSEIFDTISDENCPTLTGKTKLIVIQACRTCDHQQDSDKDDDGVIVSDGQSHNNTGQAEASASSDNIRSTYAHQKDLFNVPQDVIVIFPTAAGKRSKRDKEKGSWLLRGFTKSIRETKSNLQDRGIPINFLKIVTTVSQYIAKRETRSSDESKRGKKTTVCSYHRLTKPFYFKFADTTGIESNVENLGLDGPLQEPDLNV